MVLETRSALESGVQGSGHSFAATRLDAQRSIAGWVAEQTGGLSYLESIRQLAKRVDDDWEGVQADLQSIRCGDQACGFDAVLSGLVCLGSAPPDVCHIHTTACIACTPLPLQDSTAAAARRHRQHDW
jgi:Peptidase M16C associated